MLLSRLNEAINPENLEMTGSIDDQDNLDYIRKQQKAMMRNINKPTIKKQVADYEQEKLNPQPKKQNSSKEYYKFEDRLIELLSEYNFRYINTSDDGRYFVRDPHGRLWIDTDNHMRTAGITYEATPTAETQFQEIEWSDLDDLISKLGEYLDVLFEVPY